MFFVDKYIRGVWDFLDDSVSPTHTVSSENPNKSFKFCAIGGRSRFN